MFLLEYFSSANFRYFFAFLLLLLLLLLSCHFHSLSLSLPELFLNIFLSFFPIRIKIILLLVLYFLLPISLFDIFPFLQLILLYFVFSRRFCVWRQKKLTGSHFKAKFRLLSMERSFFVKKIIKIVRKKMKNELKVRKVKVQKENLFNKNLNIFFIFCWILFLDLECFLIVTQ